MRWLACVLLSFLVATCGQKGPLTLPEDEASRTAPVSSASQVRSCAQAAPSAREGEPMPERYGVAGESLRPERRA